jgi:hypothetical protein
MILLSRTAIAVCFGNVALLAHRTYFVDAAAAYKLKLSPQEQLALALGLENLSTTPSAPSSSECAEIKTTERRKFSSSKSGWASNSEPATFGMEKARVLMAFY